MAQWLLDIIQYSYVIRLICANVRLSISTRCTITATDGVNEISFNMAQLNNETMNLSPFRRNFKKIRSSKIFYHSLKERPIFSKIAKYHWNISWNKETKALKSWQFLHTFLLRAWKTNTQGHQLGINSKRDVLQKYKQLTNFARLYIPFFTIYYNQTWQFF